MVKLYTTAGIFKLKNAGRNNCYPTVVLSDRECSLDMQEMLLWTVMNRRILTYEEIKKLYEKKEKELSFVGSRSFEVTLKRLEMRGLAASGGGKTGYEALYNLLSKLYIIPIKNNIFVRLYSFLRMRLLFGIPHKKAKSVFKKDRRTAIEKRVMKLAFETPLSAAEIIKCVDKGVLGFGDEDEMINFLYDDRDTNSENIAEYTRGLSASRPVIASVANLYLRQQILFERL